MTYYSPQEQYYFRKLKLKEEQSKPIPIRFNYWYEAGDAAGRFKEMGNAAAMLWIIKHARYKVRPPQANFIPVRQAPEA
jgi:hypothetical protein